MVRVQGRRFSFFCDKWNEAFLDILEHCFDRYIKECAYKLYPTTQEM